MITKFRLRLDINFVEQSFFTDLEKSMTCGWLLFTLDLSQKAEKRWMAAF